MTDSKNLHWLTILGIGEDGVNGLSVEAKTALLKAEVLIGGERHLGMISELDAPKAVEKRKWPQPFLSILEQLEELKGRRTCVVATGDPLLYGAGETLVKRLDREEYTVIPHISAFSLAAARMGWPLTPVELVTLHGRPVSNLAPHLYPGARIFILSEDRTTPQTVADYLKDIGISDLWVTVLAHMGGEREVIRAFHLSNIPDDLPDFHTLALELPSTAPFLPSVPGLPDSAFVHDGKMTKREVRAAAMAKLMPHPGAVLWDIGAGCGSLTIEWLRAAKRTRVFALEPHEGRRALMEQNAARLAPNGLTVINGKAPAALDPLPEPDAIFLGGGVSKEVVDRCILMLKPGGRLVAHAVTLESEAVLLGEFEVHGGELARISVSRASPVGPYHGWKPLMPVTQWSYVKP